MRTASLGERQKRGHQRLLEKRQRILLEWLGRSWCGDGRWARGSLQVLPAVFTLLHGKMVVREKRSAG